VFGGLIFLDKEDSDIQGRKYISLEKKIRKNNPKYSCIGELKAHRLDKKYKNKLYNSLYKCYKFGVIINICKLTKINFGDKKAKQRYLDYAYKLGLKNALMCMCEQKIIFPEKIKNIYIYADEHSTATNGRYDLQHSIEKELKEGIINRGYHPPIFPKMDNVIVEFCNSESKILVRAADIIAHMIYYKAGNEETFGNEPNIFIHREP
jgi:hypothetical protein